MKGKRKMNGQELKCLRDTLESEIKKSSNVFLVGHNSPDFDSIGSCIGLYTIAEQLGKKVYIIVDDEESKIEPGVKRIIDENKERFRFIKKEEFEKLVDKKSLLIVADVNKDYMVSVNDSFDKLRSIIVIDHHSEDEHTISTNKKFISTQVSSASEIVARLLSAFRMNYSKQVANFLLAGINLDTKRFKQNTTSKTHDVAEKLIDNGADIDYVNNLFLEEFESFCRISNLIVNGTVIKKYSDSLAPIQVSFTLNRNNPQGISPKEDYAKAADRMMKFNGIDASFALGFIEDGIVHISARGGKKVNVGKIMQAMHGGGTPQSAGGRIETNDIFQVEDELMEKINIGLSEEESIIEEPPVIKVKQIKHFKKS